MFWMKNICDQMSNKFEDFLGFENAYFLIKNIKYCVCHVFCIENTQKIVFSKSKKSKNLSGIGPQIHFFQNFEVLTWKLLFLKFFRSKKYPRKSKWIKNENYVKIH